MVSKLLGAPKTLWIAWCQNCLVSLLRHHLLTLHGTENHPFYWHELLPDETLAAAGAQEALCGCVPAKVVIGHPLHFRVDGIVASLTHLLRSNTDKEKRESDQTAVVTILP